MMKDWFMIPLVLAVFAFGYYVMKKVDLFIEENQRLIAAENLNSSCGVHIAAENPMLFNSIASALEHCSEADPYIEFFLSSGRSHRLLEKLAEEQIDILLLNEEHAKQIEPQFASILIPYVKAKTFGSTFGLPIENLDEESGICVVWKRNKQSKNRDRVIFALENEHCRMKCGYADYLD